MIIFSVTRQSPFSHAPQHGRPVALHSRYRHVHGAQDSVNISVASLAPSVRGRLAHRHTPPPRKCSRQTLRVRCESRYPLVTRLALILPVTIPLAESSTFFLQRSASGWERGGIKPCRSIK